jgi:dCMP deaminase
MDETWLAVASILARRGTCIKARVGCVLADAGGRLLAANYNGVASGQPHCNEEVAVRGSKWHPGGKIGNPHACNSGRPFPPGADLCEAVHAEQNALTRCKYPDEILTCYSTISPCMRCAKQLLNTGCRRIVFAEEYLAEPQARRLWEDSGREWLALTGNQAGRGG